MIHQDAPHQAARHRKEVCSILPADFLYLEQTQVRLVDKSTRLKRMARAFSCHIAAGQASEFRVDERDQLVERRLIAGTPGNQQFGDLPR